jgi:biopolymer transport protein ExbB/TolQ
MDINLLELWGEMGLPVRGVVILLTLQAVASLAVAVDRLVVLMRSDRVSRAFADRAVPLMAADDWDGLLKEASTSRGSHLANLMHAGLGAFLARRDHGDSPARAAELARRSLERRGTSLSDELNRGMNVLATTGSTAPFVGLLGTVLGIIHAFHLIASEGSGGIGTIGSSIGEALIVTGYGLLVAIPTVFVFNWLSGKIARFELGLTNAASELLDRLECLDEAAPKAPREAARSEPSRDEPTSTEPRNGARKLRVDDLPAPARA